MLGEPPAFVPIEQKNNNQLNSMRFSPVTKYHIAVQTPAVLCKLSNLLSQQKNAMESDDNRMLKRFFHVSPHDTRAVIMRAKSTERGLCDYRRICQYLDDCGIPSGLAVLDRWPTNEDRATKFRDVFGDIAPPAKFHNYLTSKVRADDLCTKALALLKEEVKDENWNQLAKLHAD